MFSPEKRRIAAINDPHRLRRIEVLGPFSLGMSAFCNDLSAEFRGRELLTAQVTMHTRLRLGASAVSDVFWGRDTSEQQTTVTRLTRGRVRPAPQPVYPPHAVVLFYPTILRGTPPTEARQPLPAGELRALCKESDVLFKDIEQSHDTRARQAVMDEIVASFTHRFKPVATTDNEVIKLKNRQLPPS